jgi:hypothetical protein
LRGKRETPEGGSRREEISEFQEEWRGGFKNSAGVKGWF